MHPFPFWDEREVTGWFLSKKGTKLNPQDISISLNPAKSFIGSYFKAQRLDYVRGISAAKKWASLLNSTPAISNKKETVAA